jgi:serine protease inhibitor
MEAQGYDDVKALVAGNTTFALDLYRELRGNEGNLSFSPYSMSVALGMTYAGARGNTGVQMARVLHFALDQDRLHPAFASVEARLRAVQDRGDIRLRVANSLWPQEGYPLLDEFLALTERFYGVVITPLNYDEPEVARQRINAWVEERTEGKIEDLIPPGALLALLVLVNAIAFKGNWLHRFDEALTQDAPFWLAPGNQIRVPLMQQLGTFGYAQVDDLHILELPYAGDDVSMVVFLPAEIDGLAALEDSLSVENLNRWMGRLRASEVQVYLPRFKMKCGFRLGARLKAMGMTDAFDDSADFSRIDSTHSLYISAVFHQAYVDVNEEGTEAAAATAVVMAPKGIPLPSPTFRADHPFLFLIRERTTGSILFLGRVVNPAPAI